MNYSSLLFIFFVAKVRSSEKAKNECGNELLTESRGTISSPNYSSFNNSTYPPNINCKWNKEGNHTLLTEVRVLDLDIEPGPNGSNRSCSYDNLIIKFESLRRGITLCGNYTPNETFRGQGDFEVSFRSDDSITFRGFNLQYTFTENFTRCDPNPCMNGGNCSENIYGFECHCNDNYKGTYCEEEKTICGQEICKNGAKCEENKANNTFNCNCTEDWTGVFCDKEKGCKNPGLESGPEKFKFGDQLNFNCSEDYELIGEPYVICLGENSWNYGLPSCKLKSRSKFWTYEMTIALSTLSSCFLLVFVSLTIVKFRYKKKRTNK